MSDVIFAKLAKSLKQNTGSHVNADILVAWYKEEYYMAFEDKHEAYYMKCIAEILCNYVERHKLMTLTDLFKTLNADSWGKYSFGDRSIEQNALYQYTVAASICGKLVWTKCSDIPEWDQLKETV